MDNNIILRTDSYKFSHYWQYPPSTEYIRSYFSSRGGKFPEILFFGLQAILKKHLIGQVVTQARIDEAVALSKGHGVPVNREGWEYILKEHGGRLPLTIHATPEGLLLPAGMVAMTAENTDPKCFWLTNYLETLLVHVWYLSTVATQSWEIKQVIGDYMEQTGGSREGLDFKLHDFGFRGVSSVESAGLGGMAHLVNFKGTDTPEGIRYAMKYYDSGVCGFSIPASEHSTITSWGREGEVDAYRNMLKQYPTGLVACVSDSYDIFHACGEIWGGVLKDEVMGRDGTLVIRPDSGNPIKTTIKCLDILTDKFGYTTTPQGYKLLPPQVRLIWGDGIDGDGVLSILEAMKINRYAADNIAFGMGGGLLQKLDRDTSKYAFKCSSAIVDGAERDVYKDPVGSSKASKRGRVSTYLVDGDYEVMREEEAARHDFHPVTPVLREVFRDGELLVDDTFDEVRSRAIG